MAPWVEKVRGIGLSSLFSFLVVKSSFKQSFIYSFNNEATTTSIWCKRIVLGGKRQ